MRLWFSTLSEIGMVRAKNDDSAYAGPRLLAVADGMGGPPGGDIASALTIDALRELDVTSPAESPEREAERLTEAALLANNRISARVDSESRLHGMGTTLTAALFTGQALVFGHIGDSRAYLYRPADRELAAAAATPESADAATAALPGLVQLTKDHTFVQSLVDEGQITPEQAETHSHRSWLIRAVDGRADNDPDTFFVDLVTDDRVLLCSDGLTGFVTIPAIRDHLAAAPDPAQACQALVSLALDAGAPDNVTCVVAFVVDVADDPAGPTGIGAASAPVTADVLDSQHPMLVGAVAALVGDDSGEITMSDASGTALLDHAEDDETRAHRSSEQAEADRYAPRLQSRWRRLRRIVVALAVVAILVIAGAFGYEWTQRQYYVGPITTAGQPASVGVYRGISQPISGLKLANVFEPADLRLEQLPTYQRDMVSQTISARDLADARDIVANLQTIAAACAIQSARLATPTPTPKPSPSGSTRATPGATPSRSATPAPTPTASATPTPTGVSDIPFECSGVIPATATAAP
ncbi:MAG TPA: protein phosphatase 2C domain-containing protein [Actinopolymorphaceae bacterium]|jgi:protein phosphatase